DRCSGALGADGEVQPAASNRGGAGRRRQIRRRRRLPAIPVRGVVVGVRPGRERRATGPGSRGPGQGSPTTGRRTSRTRPAPEEPAQAAEAAPRIASRFTSRALILLLVLAILGVSYAS